MNTQIRKWNCLSLGTMEVFWKAHGSATHVSEVMKAFKYNSEAKLLEMCRVNINSEYNWISEGLVCDSAFIIRFEKTMLQMKVSTKI